MISKFEFRAESINNNFNGLNSGIANRILGIGRSAEVVEIYFHRLALLYKYKQLLLIGRALNNNFPSVRRGPPVDSAETY